ncbi:MAG: hypothetical protein BJ554DRAFT_4062 [Olpidium bornovanus]|uniref:Uncharacterized protein n=1 Tax=Olpidium bornovanus TaxID=278681 RepID=A0A8H8A0C4_9FUNG|nr:MAG: hypothetical protein BJ554DRAFT_4062 [Olpidium bornovanus]
MEQNKIEIEQLRGRGRDRRQKKKKKKTSGAPNALLMQLVSANKSVEEVRTLFELLNERELPPQRLRLK